MENVNDIPKCEKCGATLVERTNKAKGNKFWACPKWLPNNAGCEGFTWSPSDGKSEGGAKKYVFQTEGAESLQELIKIRKLLTAFMEETMTKEQE